MKLPNPKGSMALVLRYRGLQKYCESAASTLICHGSFPVKVLFSSCSISSWNSYDLYLDLVVRVACGVCWKREAPKREKS